MMFRLLSALLLVVLVPAAHAQAARMPAAAQAATPAEETVRVPMLKQAVRKGEVVTAGNIVMTPISASDVFASTITNADELTGQQAVRTLIAGKPVNRLHVRVAPLISRDQIVTMVYTRGGIELSGSAQALEDGVAGASIRILNPVTHTTLTGTVQPDGTVKID